MKLLTGETSFREINYIYSTETLPDYAGTLKKLVRVLKVEADKGTFDVKEYGELYRLIVSLGIDVIAGTPDWKHGEGGFEKYLERWHKL